MDRTAQLTKRRAAIKCRTYIVFVQYELFGSIDEAWGPFATYEEASAFAQANVYVKPGYHPIEPDWRIVEYFAPNTHPNLEKR